MKNALSVRWILTELYNEGHVSKDDFNIISTTPVGYKKRDWHALKLLSESELVSPLDKKKMDAKWLTTWLSKYFNIPVKHVDPLKIEVAKVTEVMSATFAERHNILAVGASENEIEIAICEPGLVHEWLKDLQKIQKDKGVSLVLVEPEKLTRYRAEFYNLAKSIKGAETSPEAFSGITNFEQLIELSDGADANDKHIVNIVDWLLQYAYQQRASDIHIEPRREAGNLRFRIDGVLHDVYEMPVNITAAVISRLKILSRLNVAEKRRPQDGRIKTLTPNGQEIELRLSTLPTAFGEKLVMRIFDPEVLVRSFEELGLQKEDLSLWNEWTSHPNGIIFVTGPTGSGKTTTLYSTLKRLATREVNVCTIEDPIEMIDDALNQTQVQQNLDVGFAEGVKAMLRQDPDIIMIGEIRDLPTAEMAIQAALTGHLVLTTLHTNDAPSSVTRLLDLGVPSYLISATTLGVLAQRLVRTLCPACKESVDMPDEAWKELTHPWKAPKPEKMCVPKGCTDCRNTGYRGRKGLYEMMPVSQELKRLVNRSGELRDLQQQAYKEGVKPLRLRGAQAVAKGETSIEEVMRVTPMHDF